MHRIAFAATSLLASAASFAALLSLPACSSTDSAATPSRSNEQMNADASADVVFSAGASRVVVTHMADLVFSPVDGGNCATLKGVYTFDVAAGTLAYNFCPLTGPHLAQLQTGTLTLTAADRANLVASLQAVTVLPTSTAMCVPDDELETADVTTDGVVAHYVDEMGACAEMNAPGATPTTGLDHVSAILIDIGYAHVNASSDGGVDAGDGGD